MFVVAIFARTSRLQVELSMTEVNQQLNGWSSLTICEAVAADFFFYIIKITLLLVLFFFSILAFKY